MEKISIEKMSNGHSDWLRALDFYRQELFFLKERLTEIAQKNTNKDALKQIEHYENQFKIQIDNIDRLQHDISSNVSEAAKEAENSKAGYIDKTLVTEQGTLLNRYEMMEKTFDEIRHDFNRFSVEWM